VKNKVNRHKSLSTPHYVRLRKREKEKRVLRHAAREGLYTDRHFHRKKDGAAGLDVATSGLGGGPTTTNQNVFDTHALEVAARGATVTKRVRHVRRRQAECSAGVLETTAKGPCGKGEEARVRRSGGEENPDKGFDRGVLNHHPLILASLGHRKTQSHVHGLDANTSILGVSEILSTNIDQLADTKQTIEAEERGDGVAEMAGQGEPEGDEAGKLPSERRVGATLRKFLPATKGTSRE